MIMKPNILVLGGGMAGLVASNELKSTLGDEANVTLIDRRVFSQFPPSFVWVMTGERSPDDVQKELLLLKRKGIGVINAEVLSIDTKDKAVMLSNSKFPLHYDYLVIALGAEYAPESIPGFSQFANHNYDLESALKLGKLVEEFRGGQVAVGISRLPYKCPVAPYEAAILLHEHLLRRNKESSSKFVFFTPETIPLPAAGPSVGAQAEELMKQKGIEVHTRINLKEITPNNLIFNTGEQVEYDLLYCVPPHRAPRVVVDAGLEDSTGWIPSNPKTMQTKVPSVYAIGDVASLPTPKAFVPYLPKAGTFAVGQARIAAANIANEVRGSGVKKNYDGHGACFMEVGSGMSAMVEGNFLGETNEGATIEFKPPNEDLHGEKRKLEERWKSRWF